LYIRATLLAVNESLSAFGSEFDSRSGDMATHDRPNDPPPPRPDDERDPKDDDTPETPPTEAPPVPVKEPPDGTEPRGPFVVR
jgi:hypothetical protein